MANGVQAGCSVLAITTALIVAAGSSRRFGDVLPKQYTSLAGAAILRHTVNAFQMHPAVDRVCVVIDPLHRSLYDAAVAGLGLPEPVSGGATRQESVCRGLEALSTASGAGGVNDFVLIHDAARPMIGQDTITRVINALAEAPAVIAAIEVTDTLKRVTSEGIITDTIDRAGLWRAQTPQGFRLGDILDAHRRFPHLSATDDAQLAQAAGLRVTAVVGEDTNLKVTTQDDLSRTLMMMQSHMEFRTGSGLDVHKFAPGDHVTLCGVRIPHDACLEGHSDADVGLHALTDAILATIGAGDIGTHFPPTDPRWKGADSRVFLKHAHELLTAAGAVLIHVDVTIVCEYPRIGPHRPAMVACLTELLGLGPGRASVKATTSETLGFTGRGEGVLAQAMATVRLG